MKPAQRGAALLLAMIILTLVSAVAAGMVWQQSRAIQVEAAERARTQAVWILNGALDWGRDILRRDSSNRAGGPDQLREINEMRLSSFLAADQNNNADGELEAFFSGRIVDAQSRYNLRNLIDTESKLSKLEQGTLQRLCEAAGVPAAAEQLANGLLLAWTGGGGDAAATTPLAPTRVSQLAWLGLDGDTLERLAPFVEILPVRTPININTASREVLVAVIEGLDLATAERIILQRATTAFANVDDLRLRLGLRETLKTDAQRVNVSSSYFDVYGQLRVDDRVVEERSLLERKGIGSNAEVTAVRRERRSLRTASP